MHWFASLSWSHALLVVLLVLIALGSLLMVLLKPRENEPPEGRPWPLVDYSAQYRHKVQWLGNRYLLARPINRRAA